MGGERASKTRQRERGEICWRCSNPIGTAATGKERLCDRCRLNQPRHRVLMNYTHMADGWWVSFLEADCKTPLSRKLRFATSDKLIEMARKGGADLTSASRCDLEHGIGIGRGGIWLKLTADQYKRLT